MPDEKRADIQALGSYAKQRLEGFNFKTSRRLLMEIEPGTYVIALAGFLVLSVLDKKDTGPDGFRFLVADGAMEVNLRPFLYGSCHPFSVVTRTGNLLSTDFDTGGSKKPFVVVGRCCESGDALTLDEAHHIVERPIAEPQTGDYLVAGGCGAYCSAMTPFNYNSHTQIPELLLTEAGETKLIRKAQRLEQVVQNEMSLQK